MTALSPFGVLAVACGWGPSALAEASGVPARSVRRLWRTATRPSAATAQRLSGPLGVTPADVLAPGEWLDRHGLGPSSAPAPALLPTPRVGRQREAGRAARLARAWSLPPTGRSGWERRAVCADADPELFWPEKGECADAALALCARCPVLGDCREAFFRQGHDEGGVWFATTHNDRREHRRAQRERERREVA